MVPQFETFGKKVKKLGFLLSQRALRRVIQYEVSFRPS